MRKHTDEEPPFTEEKLKQALRNVEEEIRVLYSKRMFGRVEVHMARGRIELIRTLKDQKP